VMAMANTPSENASSREVLTGTDRIATTPVAPPRQPR
jgi:hypothetical protein